MRIEGDPNGRPRGTPITHAHMDKTGGDQSAFSIQKSPLAPSDYHTAESGSPVGKVNESSPGTVQRLTPQTDGSKPQIRPIAGPTAAELKKYGDDGSQEGSPRATSQAPQASNAEPGQNAADGMGLAFLGGGPKPGPAQ